MGKGRFLALVLAAMLIAVGLAGAASAAPAAAGKMYVATLTGAEEVPPRTTPATGSATFELSADGGSIAYTVRVENITNVIMGHIHLGKKGENGAVVVTLIPQAQPGGGKASGVIGQGTITADKFQGSLQGKGMAELLAAMDSGNAYVNVHTNDGVDPQNSGPGDFPGGEIRGQIAMAAAPSAAPSAAPGLPNTGAGGAAADPLVIQLKTQNNSGQSGTATLTDMGNGTTKVVVDLANSPAGPQPMHIHTGTCANLGPVKFPLTNLTNGKSETIVNVALADILAAPHAINAHKSAQEAAVYVACGEVVGQVPTAAPRTGAGGMAARPLPLLPIALAAFLTVLVGAASFTLRRRQA